MAKAVKKETKKKGRPKGSRNSKGRKFVGKYGWALLKEERPICPECFSFLSPPAVEYDIDSESKYTWFCYICSCGRHVKVYTKTNEIGKKHTYPIYKKQKKYKEEKPQGFTFKRAERGEI